MNAVLATLNESRKTSETKAVLVAALWAGSAMLVPGIPMILPEMDLTGIGLGTVSLSPVHLILYAITRAVIKVGTDGAFPFMPNPTPAKETAPDA